MKKIFTLLSAVFLTAIVFAQSPEKMSYQAIIRDSNSNLITNSTIGMQISILQGSETGTVVYVQVCNPTTNDNGLISIPIGYEAGFDIIDWSAGPYFIKTETDITGGTSYTIEGISQLLSVPFALYAKTAETVTGTITETDPVFGASVASGITATDTTYWNHKQEQLTAGTGISIVGNTINATVSTTLAIGQSYQGGIIFWLDASGQHGLIAATADQSTAMQWYNGANTTTNAVRDGIGAGMYNTERIIASQGTGDYAAQLCANYQSGGYGDWYLPSKYELNLLYLQRTAVGGFAGSGYYWSSNDFLTTNAWVQRFDVGGSQDPSFSKNYTLYVRAVRAF